MLDTDRMIALEAASAPVPALRKLEAGRGRLGAVARLIATLRTRLRHRRDMRQLALFEPDEVLRDVGISRETAWREARKSLWRP
jgi:uncharacterized protein YjiS (DUF1127 family)